MYLAKSRAPLWRRWPRVTVPSSRTEVECGNLESLAVQPIRTVFDAGEGGTRKKGEASGKEVRKVRRRTSMRLPHCTAL